MQPHDSDGSENNHQVNVRLRETGVELQHVPVAVPRLGLSFMPNVDDLVLVVFVNDDINAPVVVGSVYDENVSPPVGKAAELVYMPADPDDSSIRRLHFELGNGSLITVDDDKLTIKLARTELVINSDGDISIKGDAKLEVKAQSDITFEASGNLELKAQGNVKINGAAVDVEGREVPSSKRRQSRLPAIRSSVRVDAMPGPPVTIGCAVMLSPGAAGPPDSGFITTIMQTVATANGMPLATSGSMCQMVNSVSGAPYPLPIGPGGGSGGVLVDGQALVRVRRSDSLRARNPADPRPAGRALRQRHRGAVMERSAPPRLWRRFWAATCGSTTRCAGLLRGRRPGRRARSRRVSAAARPAGWPTASSNLTQALANRLKTAQGRTRAARPSRLRLAPSRADRRAERRARRAT